MTTVTNSNTNTFAQTTTSTTTNSGDNTMTTSTITTGSIVNYKNEEFIVVGFSSNGRLQLSTLEGVKRSGTPGVDKVNYVRSLPVEEYNGVSYIYNSQSDTLCTKAGLAFENRDNPQRKLVVELFNSVVKTAPVVEITPETLSVPSSLSTLSTSMGDIVNNSSISGQSNAACSTVIVGGRRTSSSPFIPCAE